MAALQPESKSTPVKPGPDAPTEEPPCKKMRVSELLGITQQHEQPDFNKALLTSSGSWAAAEAIAKSMPKDCGVPLTILTGFLGAGKSTVLNYILKADHGLKIAVLINEFGEVDIDNQLVDTMAQGTEGKPVMLNNGCVCCTISSGFAEAVRQTLADAENRNRFPDYFIVETTGLADPQPIMESINSTELREDLYLDQVLTVVDASAWTADHYESPTAMKQIESADTILLSKTDLINDTQLDSVVEAVLAVRPQARILRSQKGSVPIAALFDLGISLTGPRTRKKSDKVANDHEHTHDHSHDHKHDHNHDHSHDHHHSHDHNHDHKNEKRNHLEEEGFTSVSFVSEFPLSMRRFKDNFMELLPKEVFRAKGLLWFVGESTRFIFHWSGSRFTVEEQHWPENVEHKNQLVIIGRQLDKETLFRMLEDCLVRPGEESEEEPEEEYSDGNEDGVYGGEGDDEEGGVYEEVYADGDADDHEAGDDEAENGSGYMPQARTDAGVIERPSEPIEALNGEAQNDKTDTVLEDSV